MQDHRSALSSGRAAFGEAKAVLVRRIRRPLRRRHPRRRYHRNHHQDHVDHYQTPHSEQLHVIERFHLIDDGKTLEVNVHCRGPRRLHHAVERNPAVTGAWIGAAERTSSARRTTGIISITTSSRCRRRTSRISKPATSEKARMSEASCGITSQQKVRQDSDGSGLEEGALLRPAARLAIRRDHGRADGHRLAVAHDGQLGDVADPEQRHPVAQVGGVPDAVLPVSLPISVTTSPDFKPARAPAETTVDLHDHGTDRRRSRRHRHLEFAEAAGVGSSMVIPSDPRRISPNSRI